MPSRQRVHGGGKFKSEQQRKFMWAVVPKAAKKWADNMTTNKGDWRGARGVKAARSKLSVATRGSRPSNRRKK